MTDVDERPPRRVFQLWDGSWEKKLSIPPRMELSDGAERLLREARAWFQHKQPLDIARCDHLGECGPTLRGLVCVQHPRAGVKCARCFVRHRSTKHPEKACRLCKQPAAETLIVATWTTSITGFDLRQVGLVGWPYCLRHARPLPWTPSTFPRAWPGAPR